MNPVSGVWTAPIFLLCYQLYCVTSNITERENVSITARSFAMELRDLPEWFQLPRPRTALSPHQTRWGRTIPGRASANSCCGRANPTAVPRIVGGNPIDPHQFPWLAALVEPGKDRPFCGGTLINDRYVLTAAHCLIRVRPRKLQVILGKHRLDRDSVGDLRLNVSRIRRHPLFFPFLLGYDMALLRLEMPLKLPVGENRIAPVCLPGRGRYRRANVTAAGWGIVRPGGQRPQQAHSVPLQHVPSGHCGVLNAPFPIFPSMVCASGDLSTGGSDACQGDSGGPLTVSVAVDGDQGKEKRHALLGVTSWGVGCARPMTAGVYARVTALLDWILASTEDATYC